MSLFYGDTKEALSHREIFLEALGIDYRGLVCAQQTHSDHVRRVDDADRGRGALEQGSALADTDAFVTDKRKLALAIFTADCLPVFLYDPQSSSIGLAHAGWKGVMKGIASKTALMMQSSFGARPQDIYAGFGPAIRSCCCQVGEEFREYFSSGIFFREGSYYLDFVSVAKKQLLEAGLKEENISDCRLCTSCHNSEYFSFRREGEKAGRMISVIMLK